MPQNRLEICGVTVISVFKNVNLIFGEVTDRKLPKTVEIGKSLFQVYFSVLNFPKYQYFTNRFHVNLHFQVGSFEVSKHKNLMMIKKFILQLDCPKY